MMRLLAPFAFLICGAVFGQAWTTRQLTSLDGLPQNSVLSLALDSNGYLLLSTEGGLVRYDGLTFRRIGLIPDPRKTGGRTRELIGLTDGSLVIRDAGNTLYRIGQHTAERSTTREGITEPLPRLYGAMPNMELLRRACDPTDPPEGKEGWGNDVVWVLPTGGSKWVAYGRDGLYFYDGRRAVGHVAGTVPHLAMVRLKGRDLLFGRDLSVQELLADGRLHRPFHQLGMPVPVADHRKQDLFWRYGEDHACYFNGERLWRITISDTGDTLRWQDLGIELPTDCSVMDVRLDPSGDVLFVGTDTDGLYVHTRQRLRTVGLGEGSNVSYAQALYGDSALLVQTGHGAAYVDITTGVAHETELLGSTRGRGLFGDERGRVWFGRREGIKWIRPDQREPRIVVSESAYAERTGISDPAPNLEVCCFMPEGDSLWIGTVSGIGLVVDDEFRMVTPIHTDQWSDRPSGLCRAPEGCFLVATCGGLLRMDPDSGLVKETAFPGRCPRVLTVIGERVFIGTYGDGAFVRDGGVYRKMPPDQNGLLTHVHAFVDDGKGKLWLSSNQGLFRVDKHELEAWLVDPGNKVYYERFGKEEGILNAEFNGGCDPPYLELPGGLISFPSMSGLVWVPLAEEMDLYPKASLHLEGVLADGVELGAGAVVELPLAHKVLVLRFSVPYWGDVGNVQLEYSLNGAWSPVLPGQRELQFQRLPPGQHELQVRKVGAVGRGDLGQLSLVLNVPYPFHRTWPFYGLLVLVAGLLVYATVYMSAAYLRRRNQSLEAQVAMRTADLQKANTQLERSVEVKQMLMSIISHDIISPLHFIARVSNKATTTTDPGDLRTKLADISHSSDRLFNHAQNLLSWMKHQQGAIEVVKRHVALRALVDEMLDVVRKKAEDQGVELVNEVPFDDVLRTDPEILMVLVQNLLSNALVHAKAGRVVVSGRAAYGAYLIAVADNGVGLPFAVLNGIQEAQRTGGYAHRSTDRSHGLGYVIVFGMAQLLGADLDVVSRTGAGTTVSVWIPG